MSVCKRPKLCRHKNFFAGDFAVPDGLPHGLLIPVILRLRDARVMKLNQS
jgi:hypothetical protein